MTETLPYALIALTKHGTRHALRLHHRMEDSDLYLSAKMKEHVPPGTEGNGVRFFEGQLAPLTARIFHRYAGLVYFVSLGAVVRVIAPALKDKHTDPAVVVVDDTARWSISVLSGHIGGANTLAQRVAELLGATPVVTTASDVNKTVPVDLVGREFGWSIENEENVTPVSAAVVNEWPAALYQDAGEPDWWEVLCRHRRGTAVAAAKDGDSPMPGSIQRVASLREAEDPRYRAALLITDQHIPDGPLRRKSVIYRPRSLCLGMGCDIGADPEAAERLLMETLAKHGLSPRCLRSLATLDRKQGEPALDHLIQKFKLEAHYYTPEELKAMGEPPSPSQKVYKYTRLLGVSEPAAMRSAGTRELLVPKVKAPMLTLAIARWSPPGGNHGT
ncbi:MAG: cobalamin biosynthesis protein [Euryarchaeota archaeon]|nr:cobalamin biosynthesis protein [Euryarchaeota archaeon]